MKSPQRGEVWLIDLGFAAKTRPAVVVSIEIEDADRALLTIVPHTTSARGSRFGKTLAEWSRTAFPGRREVTTPHDGLGRPSYEASSPFG